MNITFEKLSTLLSEGYRGNIQVFVTNMSFISTSIVKKYLSRVAKSAVYAGCPVLLFFPIFPSFLYIPIF